MNEKVTGLQAKMSLAHTEVNPLSSLNNKPKKKRPLVRLLLIVLLIALAVPIVTLLMNQKMQKDGLATEDELKKFEKDVQNLTDKSIANINADLAAKEADLKKV